MRVSPIVRDEESAEFFDGTRAGRLLLRRYRATGEYADPRTEGEDLEAVPAAGTGRVVSWTVVHRRSPDGGEPERAVVGIVELDEGPWWWGPIADADPDADLADLRVRVGFVPSGPEPEHEMLPVFRPAEEKGGAR